MGSLVWPDLAQAVGWLPIFFLGAMGVAMVAYVVLDGYDLGVGILLKSANDAEKDAMISSIGPFWDANETWLVLGVGILLVAFPIAHGIILTNLYLPVAAMLAGLILRGVSFDFRVKAQAHHKPIWNYLFHFGSLVAAMAQGLMIGRYIVGFESGLLGWLFAALVAICLPMGYMLLGSTWLIMKTTDELQAKAVGWARKSLWLTAAGVGLISLATPYFSARIMQKWFVLPNMIWLSPLPLLTLVCFFLIHRSLNHLDTGKLHLQWHPFVLTIVVFLLAFLGIAYSLFPYLIIDQMTIWQAAAATESLWFIFWGAVIVLPTIILYTIYSYWIFWGKAQPLTYY